jgi:glycine/D-amino acid oxidase-like deaminating enzyme/nitrite reductase/ring-hydroxylating ferredoxin subunit
MASALTSDSYWVRSAPERDRCPPLPGDDLRVDVAVVGGGLVGITTALLLQRAGRSVAVLDAAWFGRQVTGGSTAKVTSQHGLIYGYLAEKFGDDAAATYARSNQAGLEWICQQVSAAAIDCDLERCPAYVYTTSESRTAEIEREARVARSLGLPADLETEIDLPVAARAAVRFDDQAQFHPVKYLEGLLRELREAGAALHEFTRVLDVKSGEPCTVIAETGKVVADDVLVATNLPILDRGGFFGRAFPYRHMCLAAPIPAGRYPVGMHISVDQPTRSTRTTPLEGGERMLIVVGESFPTGHEDSTALLGQLETFARETFDTGEIFCRWGNQDYYSSDRLPYIGRILPGSTHIRVATGFNAWGITTGTAAAMIIADDVLGEANAWASLYDARRTGLRHGAQTLLKKNVSVAGSWLAEHLRSGARRSAGTLAPGEGALARIGGKTVAAYRDAEGELHALTPYCTHLGCELHWNAAELSWDCHCHGSRFGVDGRVLGGPAVRALQRITNP